MVLSYSILTPILASPLSLLPSHCLLSRCLNHLLPFKLALLLFIMDDGERIPASLPFGSHRRGYVLFCGFCAPVYDPDLTQRARVLRRVTDLDPQLTRATLLSDVEVSERRSPVNVADQSRPDALVVYSAFLEDKLSKLDVRLIDCLDYLVYCPIAQVVVVEPEPVKFW